MDLLQPEQATRPSRAMDKPKKSAIGPKKCCLNMFCSFTVIAGYTKCPKPMRRGPVDGGFLVWSLYPVELKMDHTARGYMGYRGS